MDCGCKRESEPYTGGQQAYWWRLMGIYEDWQMMKTNFNLDGEPYSDGYDSGYSEGYAAVWPS